MTDIRLSMGCTGLVRLFLRTVRCQFYASTFRLQLFPSCLFRLNILKLLYHILAFFATFFCYEVWLLVLSHGAMWAFLCTNVGEIVSNFLLFLKIEHSLTQSGLNHVQRQEKGISQKKLEELSVVKQPIIARMEKGSTSPQLTTILKVLAPLGKTLAVVPLETVK